MGAVKLVANDWGVESLAVCGVHAQLVCATCERSELNARDAVAPVDNAKERGGWFAVLGVNYLARTVGNVGRQRQRNGAFGRVDDALQQSFVDFCDLALGKRLLQLLVNIFGFSYHHKSRCVHIEAMHNHRTFHFGVQFSVLLEQRVGNDVARHRSQPRGLVDNR